MRQLYFFATKNDLLEILKSAEAEFSLQYIKDGLFDSPHLEVLNTLTNYPKLGHAEFDATVGCSMYLVMGREEALKIRSVPQNAGGILYAIDRGLYPRGLALKLGGKRNGSCLLASHIGYLHETQDSKALYNAFLKPIRRLCRGNKMSVTKESAKLLRAGWRLTINARTRPEYDLPPDAI